MSVHGANRLGANSLLDLVVFGRGTGKNIVDKVKNGEKREINFDEKLFRKSIENIENLISNTGKSTSGDIREQMQETMQKYASVFKSKELLETGFVNLEKILEKEIKILDDSVVWNTDLIEALELKNMLSLAYLTLGASLFKRRK